MTSPILYVEDEEDYQILVKHILSRAGLDVTTVETGAEAMQMLATMRPSLLILDINLPDTDGYTISSALRRDPVWIDLPILMLTVRRRPEEWLRGFSCGANDYVSKPLNPPELIERVVSCLSATSAWRNLSSGRPDCQSPGGEERSAEYSLIQAAVTGNRSAFQILVEKYRCRLIESLGASVRNDAHLEDIVSHAFATAFEKLKEFRGEASFFTWVYRIALNESAASYRKPSAISIEELTGGEGNRLLLHSATQKPHDQIMTDREASREAMEVLDLIPKLYRDVLEMYFLQDLSYDVISRRLHIPMGTVMSRLHKARKLLQDAWQTRHSRLAVVK